MIHLGDCRRVLASVAECSIAACVTDPPYELGFMGKAWDQSGVAFDPATWAAVLRVLKPGAYLLAFGGSRTCHRITCAIEDAGFEIRDVLMWLYGSGFPKSLDVSKALDKAAGAVREVGPVDPERAGRLVNQKGNYVTDSGWSAGGRKVTIDLPATDLAQRWQGWGTALKPAYEPIILARKPLVGTVAANVTKFGTGALNIDACRIANLSPGKQDRSDEPSVDARGPDDNTDFRLAGGPRGGSVRGRWPANVILDDEAGAMLDAQSGQVGQLGPQLTGREPSVDESGRVTGLRHRVAQKQRHCDVGGASRFFYCAKVSKAERGEFYSPGGEKLAGHPTVKPLALMRYLIKLAAPPGGVVLDPFMGSGTTGVACAAEGFGFVGIESDASYVEIAKQRGVT